MSSGTVDLNNLSTGESRYLQRALKVSIEDMLDKRDEDGQVMLPAHVTALDFMAVMATIAVRKRDGIGWDAAEQVVDDMPVEDAAELLERAVTSDPPPGPATNAG